MGSSQLERINAAKEIKESELDRTIHLLKKNVASSDGDEPHNLLLNRAASLSEDLEEDEMIRSMEDHLDPGVPFERTKIK